MEDLSKYPWLALRGSTYYLRAPVPRDIQKNFGPPEIWKSLRTKDRKLAIEKLRKESSKIVAEFDAHRRELARLASTPLEELTDAQLKAIGDAYLVHVLEEDDETRELGYEERDFDEDAEWLETLDATDREE